MERRMRRACFGVLLCAMSVIAIQQHAWTETMVKPKVAKPALSVTAAVKEAIDGNELEGMRALKKRGGQFDAVQVIERLPSGGYAVEASYVVNKRHIRLPLKLKRTQIPGCKDLAWMVSWAPKAVYVNALLNVAFTTHLPRPAKTAKVMTSWRDVKRLPSMPIVLTRYQAVTPFGATSLKPPVNDSPTAAPRATNTLTPPKSLMVDAGRWIKGYLENDKAPASLDIIADGRAPWRQFQRVLFAASSLGLFKVYFVTWQGKDFGVLPSAAPVFGSFPKAKRPEPIILAYYPQKAQHGFRVSFKQAILNKEQACAPGMSFCVADVPAFDARLKVLADGMRKKNPNNVRHAMFATTGDVSLQKAIDLLSVVGQGLAVPQGHVFVGYIAR